MLSACCGTFLQIHFGRSKSLQLSSFKNKNLIAWHSAVPFGIYAQALLNLFQTEANLSEDYSKKRLTLIRKGRKLFWEILESGVAELESKCETADSINWMDQGIMSCLEYMKNRKNFFSIVKEWAFLARLRLDRNKCSHPFDMSAPRELQQSALNFYENTLSDIFAEQFRNVGILGFLNLKEKEAKIPRELQTKHHQWHSR